MQSSDCPAGDLTILSSYDARTALRLLQSTPRSTKIFKYYLSYDAFGIWSASLKDDSCDRFYDQLKLTMLLGNAALLIFHLFKVKTN